MLRLTRALQQLLAAAVTIGAPDGRRLLFCRSTEMMDAHGKPA
jgi:hypothetical protein